MGAGPYEVMVVGGSGWVAMMVAAPEYRGYD